MPLTSAKSLDRPTWLVKLFPGAELTVDDAVVTVTDGDDYDDDDDDDDVDDGQYLSLVQCTMLS